MRPLVRIALPVAVGLLAISLLEIRGHEQAMEQMVQGQAELRAVSLAALVRAHMDRNHGLLLQLADGWPAQAALAEAGAEAFPAGLALYLDDGSPVETLSTATWSALPAVESLVRSVQASQQPAAAAIDRPDGLEWLFVYAAPVTVQSRQAILAGAAPVEELAAPYIPAVMESDIGTEISLADESGRLLASWGRIGDEGAATGKIVSASVPLAPIGWRVTVREAWQDLVPPLLHFSNAVLVIMVIAVIISMLSAYFGLRNIVQPLQRLDAAASEVGWGNFAAIRQPVGGVTEIEELRVALARMAEQVHQSQQELQSYIGAMTRGQEEERRRLARELHDETVQDLIALNQRVELAAREMERHPDKAAERLHEVRSLLADTMAGLRRQIHDLRPLYLEDLGFVPALEMLVRQGTQRHDLVGDFEVMGKPQCLLDPTLEISAFRIVQEALQNVVTHAQARWVHVELHFQDEGITLRIEDNGRGFDVSTHPYQLALQGHYGLLGMRERTQLHGGTLRIESTESRGTVVTAWLPNQQS